MAVQSLSFDPSALFEETKPGSYVFDGSPSRFHQWEFYTKLKITSTKKDDKPAAMAKVIEGLRGEASNVAMDIGFEKLISPDNGLTTLTDEMRKMVFPHAAAEAKELYRAGHKLRGVISPAWGAYDKLCQKAQTVVEFIQESR